MKILSLIGPAAALLVVTWSATVLLSDYASSDSLDTSAPLMPTVSSLSSRYDGTATPLASKVQRKRLSFENYQQRRHYIDANFQRFATSAQIALELNSSLSDLDHLFQRYGHVRLEQYLAHLQRDQATNPPRPASSLALANQSNIDP